jgi:hypothetical protein
MLSLVVCSVNEIYLKQLKETVAATIGIEHEWLIWDNRKSNIGLCKIYNQLAAQAKFPYICFLHEDLLFQTQNWGKKIIELFTHEPKLGLLGIAGGKYKSDLYSGWYSGYEGFDYYNIIHRENQKDIKLLYPHTWKNDIENVVCIDGVFMVCRKEAWNENRFDESLLKGFHFYDIDFSIRVSQHFIIAVTNQVDIVHLTVGGDYGDKWVEQAFLYHDAVGGILPKSVEEVSKSEIDISVAKYWLDWLKNYKISWANKWKWISKQKLFKHASLWYAVGKFLLYKPLGLRTVHQLFKKH